MEKKYNPNHKFEPNETLGPYTAKVSDAKAAKEHQKAKAKTPQGKSKYEEFLKSVLKEKPDETNGMTKNGPLAKKRLEEEEKKAEANEKG